jgi:hypothetical protein
MRTAVVPDALRSAPFTTAQAAELGVSRSALRSTPWRHVFRDVWTHQDVPDTRETRFAAVRLVLPAGAFVCGLTAAWLFGIDVQDRRADQVWIACRTGRRLRTRPGCVVREISVDDADLCRLDGVLVTTPLRTVFDCGRWLSRIEGVVVADAIAHAGLVSVDQLAAYACSHRALRGVRRLDQMLGLMDARSESPMESRVRVLLALGGLPPPETQIPIRDRSGRIIARADMGYQKHRLLIEYDGAFHWEQRRADDRRRDAMRELGWTVMVISRDDYYETPELVVARVSAALRRAA